MVYPNGLSTQEQIQRKYELGAVIYSCLPHSGSPYGPVQDPRSPRAGSPFSPIQDPHSAPFRIPIQNLSHLTFTNSLCNI